MTITLNCEVQFLQKGIIKYKIGDFEKLYSQNALFSCIAMAFYDGKIVLFDYISDSRLSVISAVLVFTVDRRVFSSSLVLTKLRIAL